MAGDVIDRYPTCPPSISRVVDALTQEHDRWLLLMEEQNDDRDHAI